MIALQGWLGLLPLLICAGVPAAAAEPPSALPLRQAFGIEARGMPAPVPIAGKQVLRYELHLTNFASRDLVIERLRIMDGRTGRILDILEGEGLARAAGLIGGAEGADTRRVGPGRLAILYVDLALKEGAERPAALDHVVEYSDPAVSEASPAQLRAATVRPDVRPLPVLGPPLRGGPWAAVYEPAMQWGHRRVPYAVAGTVRIPGRHAIDWMRVGDDRKADANRGRGAEVLAVADATVVGVRDGIAEPTGERPRVTLDGASGNYLALDLGDGRFAFYEHLMPGLLVRQGDRVRRGQVIGRVGSTGQASAPHLHFHVADANATLDAEGIPYTLAAGDVIGAFASIEAFDRGDAWGGAAPPKGSVAGSGFFPAPNAVVRFP
jgi:murein DD-endopeptidase MepM/ murein hydrolase activator NlpD